MLIMVFIYKEQASPALSGDLAPTPSPSAQEGEAGGEGEFGGLPRSEERSWGGGQEMRSVPFVAGGHSGRDQGDSPPPHTLFSIIYSFNGYLLST